MFSYSAKKKYMDLNGQFTMHRSSVEQCIVAVTDEMG